MPRAPSSMPSEGSVRKRDRTRASLLAAAQELVLERGLATLSIQDITDRAGVALGTFYNYFRTREDVADAIAELLQRAYHADVDAIIAGLDDPARIFAASARQTLHWITPGSDVGRLLFESGVPMFRYALDIRLRALRDVQDGIAAGVFRVDDLAVIQTLLAGIVVGASIDLYFGGLDPSKIPAVVERALVLLGVPPARARRVAHEPLALRPAPTLPLRATELLTPIEGHEPHVALAATTAFHLGSAAPSAGRRRPRRARGART